MSVKSFRVDFVLGLICFATLLIGFGYGLPDRSTAPRGRPKFYLKVWHFNGKKENKLKTNLFGYLLSRPRALIK